MSENALYEFRMPEGVSRALRRLESACERDGVDSIRVDYHDGAVHVFIDDSRGNVHYCTHQMGHWFEHREVS